MREKQINVENLEKLAKSSKRFEKNVFQILSVHERCPKIRRRYVTVFISTERGQNLWNAYHH